MSQLMYSTEEVAAALGLHVRTVRGYVRDGLLPAVRIGKQYRIAGADLDAFTARPAATPPAGTPATAARPRAEASAVVQVDPVDVATMNRLASLVMGAAGTQPADQAARLHVQTVYHRERASLKFVLTGDPDAVAGLLTLISDFTGELGPDGA
jgi:excisionase family DNA binding protein